MMSIIPQCCGGVAVAPRTESIPRIRYARWRQASGGNRPWRPARRLGIIRGKQFEAITPLARTTPHPHSLLPIRARRTQHPRAARSSRPWRAPTWRRPLRGSCWQRAWPPPAAASAAASASRRRPTGWAGGSWSGPTRRPRLSRRKGRAPWPPSPRPTGRRRSGPRGAPRFIYTRSYITPIHVVYAPQTATDLIWSLI